MGQRRFLVTAALPYSNGRLHVGHVAGAYLPADTYVRYLRATGADVRFICGSDDNGVAALKTAREQNCTVEELTARHNAMQQADFAGLGIQFDIYGGTHQGEYTSIHERFSQGFFRKIHERGFFTKRTSRQLFDVKAGQFLPDRFVRGTCPHCGDQQAYGDQCEACGRTLDQVGLMNPTSVLTGTTPELRDTVHWYLQLDRFKGLLTSWLQSKRGREVGEPGWRPVVLNQSLGRIESEGLPERAMTRDLDWGVPVPLDDPDARGKSLYVWFDAPIGYVSFTAALCARLGEGESAYRDWWTDPDCKIVHFIGEDNIVFHAITWPAMLMATHTGTDLPAPRGDYQLPHNVVANSFMNIKFPGKSEEKISKSRGNAVWIEDYLKRLDADPLRYYLTAVAPEQARTAFDFDDFIQRNNGELSNTLGNFIHRTAMFCHKYFEGRVPDRGIRVELDHQQLERRKVSAFRVAEELEACHFKAALAEVMALAKSGNIYFDQTKPFLSRKTDLAECARAMNVCLQTVRTLTTLMAPFMPTMAGGCAGILALGGDHTLWAGALDELSAGHPLGPAEPLVKKLEATEIFAD